MSGTGLGGWGDDPELIATFRAEVEERLATLQQGLLSLEGHPSPRQAVGPLFRDAHTVKGSARMLGLEAVLRVAHTMEDLLGAVRDARVAPRRDVVDLLLLTCDALARALPGATSPVSEDALGRLVEALRATTLGADPAPQPDLDAGSGAPVPAAWGARAAVAVSPIPPVFAAVTPAPAVPPAAAGVDSVRVAAAKVYELLDVVGEAELGARRVEQGIGELTGLLAEQGGWLVALHDALARAGAALPADAAFAVHRLAGTAETVNASARSLRELVEVQRTQVSVVRDLGMGLAMVPVGRVASGFARLVRDVATAGGKSVRLELLGQETELDKQVLDAVADALKHLVTNAVDHGCETPQVRAAAGKSATAVVRVEARTVGSTIVVTVSDDGSGVDVARVRDAAVATGLLPSGSPADPALVLPLLFAPALSTAGSVTQHSGRGIGLDVVQSDVTALGGSVEVRSDPGAGTTFTLTLPVTLGVLRCLIARVGDERYAVPVAGVLESVSLREAVRHEAAGADFLVHHGSSVPLLDLGVALGARGERTARAAVVVRQGSGQLAWAVDRLEGEREVVVKDLGTFLARVPGVAGATIDGDGSVICLLDLRELGDDVSRTGHRARIGAVPVAQPAHRERPRVLVVEDSVGVRELERVILEKAGYTVEAAVDGLDGLARARAAATPADLVLSDVEMPGLDGFAMVRTLRSTAGWEQVPVIMMTSRGDSEARRQGLEVGANAYLLKNDFDQKQLVETVRRLVGR